MNMNFKYLSILILLLIFACGDNSEPEVVLEAKDEVKYKSYKRIIPMLEADRKLIENRSDVDNAKRYIMKTFDNYEININKNSNPEE